VSAHLPNGDSIVKDQIVSEDPVGHGIIQFENDVTVHAMLSPRISEWEAICERGSLTCWNNGWRRCLVPGTFPEFECSSSTQNLIKDLVQALDADTLTRGGIRVAYASTELIFAFIESHLQNGKRINLPLVGSELRLKRDRAPRQPRFSV